MYLHWQTINHNPMSKNYQQTSYVTEFYIEQVFGDGEPDEQDESQTRYRAN